MRIAARAAGTRGRRRLQPTVFIGQTQSGSAGSDPRSVSLPAGDLTGAYALLLAQDVNGSATPSCGWTLLGSGAWPSRGHVWALYGRQISSGDISAGAVSVTCTTQAGVDIAAYRGPSSAVLLEDNDCGAINDTTLTLPGVTKNALCAGLVSFVADRATVGSILPPAALTARGSPFSSFFRMALADQVAPELYTDGSSLLWTNFNNANFQHGWLVELRH